MVDLPDVFKKFGRCAKLERWLFGVRKAASGWKDDYGRRLVKGGFQRGRAASTMLCHPKLHECAVVHGDDFTFAATESELIKMRSNIHGSGRRDVREIENWEEI